MLACTLAMTIACLPSLQPEPGAAELLAPLIPVPFTAVHLDDAFWAPRIDRIAAVTIPHNIAQCQATGRLANFEAAAEAIRRRANPPTADAEPLRSIGYFFNDSDVYKVIEGAANILAMRDDPALEAECDRIIALIAAAQEPDGYLYTSRTINDPTNPPPGGAERWSDMEFGHELYCAGHLYEAAIAYHAATGKRALLDVAIRNAELVASVFGPGKNPHPCGHPEIELALVRLAEHVGEPKYLDLARSFIDTRGHGDRHSYGEYSQDHARVTEQTEVVGHAVRAAYLYAGVTDLAMRQGDAELLAASRRLWDEMASTKLYLTGGIGSRAATEGFGEAYDLPIAGGYSETCAAIASAMWSHRLFLATGEGRYMDMVEAVIYNAFHSGWSLEGDRFFYPNPLASRGATRPAWFACACCPPNVCRFVPAIPGYAYAVRRAADAPDRESEGGPGVDQLCIGLYMGGTATVTLGDTPVTITQETDYPWSGRINIALAPETPVEAEVSLRIPGWMTGQPLPGGLYRFAEADLHEFVVLVNGERVEPGSLQMFADFVTIRRTWTAGDLVELRLPMTPRLVVADDRVEACRGRLAIQRGPMVYCLEGIDNPSVDVRSLVLDPDARLRAERSDAAGGVTIIHAEARPVSHVNPTDPASPERALGESIRITAIPYYTWANRGPSPMTVWIASQPDAAIPSPAPTIARRATATASFPTDTSLLSDQFDPPDSASHEGGHCHWWPRKGTKEWVQYDFAEPSPVSGVEVYFFDDTGHGQCRVPAEWRVVALVDGDWQPVETAEPPGVAADRFNSVRFVPIVADALRLEFTSRPGFAGGVHEWRVLGADR